jgi:transposase
LIADLETGLFICAHTGRGVRPDLRLFQESGVRLPAPVVGECLADLGYLGLSKIAPCACLPERKPRKRELSSEQQATNRVQRRRRWPIEHLIRRLKVFRILSSRYRNRRKRYGLRLNLIAAICNKEAILAKQERDKGKLPMAAKNEHL